MLVVAAQQRQQTKEHQRVLQHLAEQQRSMLDWLVAAQAQMSQLLWEHLTQAVRQAPMVVMTGGGEGPGKPAIRISKMTNEDDQETVINSFERLLQVTE